MIGTSGEHDCQPSFLPGFCQDGFIILRYFSLVVFLCIVCLADGLADYGCGYAQAGQVFFALSPERRLVLERDSRRVDRNSSCLHAPYHLRVAGNDRAVVAVLHPGIFLFIYDKRHEYPVHAPPLQVVDVAVYQLGGEADVIRHDLTRALFVVCEVGYFGQADLQAAFRKERMPERIFLVHVQTTRNTDDHPRVREFFRAAEQQAAFLFVYIESVFLFAAATGKYFFASVTRDIRVTVFETVAGYRALVLTAVAVQGAGCVCGFGKHLFQRYGGCRLRLHGIQRTAPCTHQFRTVAAQHALARQLFQCPDHGIIAHGSALYDNMFAQCGGILQAQYLIKAVPDNGVGQPGGDVGNGRAFTQHLLYLRVHEHGAACA